MRKSASIPLGLSLAIGTATVALSQGNEATKKEQKGKKKESVIAGAHPERWVR
jgi:hypothetical protein